jgi:DNA-binding CsgD family transcriptional regulator/PAS domain-containing protein
MLDDEALSLVGGAICAQFNLDMFVAGWCDSDGRLRAVASDRYTAEAAETYGRLSGEDPWATALRRRKPDAVYASEDLVPLDEVRGSRFHREYLTRHFGLDAVHGLVGALGPPAEMGLLCGVRSGKVGPVGGDELQQATALLPALSRLVALRRAISREAAGRDASNHLLEMIAAPVIATDLAGRILYMNSQGEALLKQQHCLRYVPERGLGAVSTDDTDHLRAAIALACSGVGSTAILQKAEGPPLLAMVTPSKAMAFSAHALIVFNDAEFRGDARRLKQMFGLSAAEADVAIGLAAGDAIEEIAESRGVAVSTLRVQLKSIYSKTATSRQAELVSLVLRLHRFGLLSR